MQPIKFQQYGRIKLHDKVESFKTQLGNICKLDLTNAGKSRLKSTTEKEGKYFGTKMKLFFYQKLFSGKSTLSLEDLCCWKSQSFLGGK